MSSRYKCDVARQVRRGFLTFSVEKTPCTTTSDITCRRIPHIFGVFSEISRKFSAGSFKISCAVAIFGKYLTLTTSGRVLDPVEVTVLQLRRYKTKF